MKKILIISGVLLVIVTTLVLTVSLSNNDSETPEIQSEPPQSEAVETDKLPFELSVSNLQPLVEASTYELWVMQDSKALSLGRFNTDLSGAGFLGEFKELEGELSNGDKVFITIESSADGDDEPSETIVLSGVVDEDVEKRVNFDLPIDFNQVSGNYILGTPTNSPEDLEAYGVWFVRPGGQVASLDLPDAPNGWKYEGWIIRGTHRLSSGRFSQIDEADDFDGYSGEQSGPNFPGEDYLVNLPPGLDEPLYLADGESQVVVSFEPESEDGDPTDKGQTLPEPYIIFLSALIEKDALDHTLHPLKFTDVNLPAGYFELR